MSTYVSLPHVECPVQPRFLRAASSVGGQPRHVRLQRRLQASDEWELIAVYQRTEEAAAHAAELASQGEEVRVVAFMYCPSAR
jgi:hypothetical protein